MAGMTFDDQYVKSKAKSTFPTTQKGKVQLETSREIFLKTYEVPKDAKNAEHVGYVRRKELESNDAQIENFMDLQDKWNRQGIQCVNQTDEAFKVNCEGVDERIAKRLERVTQIA